MSTMASVPHNAAVGAERQELFAQLQGCYVTQCLSAAAELGVADIIGDSPISVEEIAERLEADVNSIGRLLRTLAGLGICKLGENGRYQLTNKGRLLRSGVPGSLRPIARLVGMSMQWRVLGELRRSLVDGRAAFEHVFGQSMWDYLSTHPDEDEIFHQAMDSFTGVEIAAIHDSYDFSGATTVVDIGGGRGRLIASVVEKFPEVEGILFDRPDVVRKARELFVRSGLSERCRAIAGDMFTTVPAGADVYIMKSVIHNWDDAAALRLLRTTCAAMNRNAVLVVATRLVKSENDSDPSKLQDLNMLVSLGGAERTEQEFERLFSDAGLAIDRVVPTRSPLHLVVVRRSNSVA
jgi:hypothetical protein